MIFLDLVLRWMHILGAAILVGGTIYQRAAWTPEVKDEAASEQAARIRASWSKLVMASSGMLLLSGLINFVLMLQRFEISDASFPGSVYHPVFGVKFLLALGVFFISSALAGRSGLAQRLREKEGMWLTLNMVMAIAVVCLAGMLKLAERAPKSSESARPQPPSVALRHSE